jgi:hypothetical protein
VGSPSSRAAARMLLKQKEPVEERKTNRPPDVRMVFDLPRHSLEVVSASAERAPGYRVDRYVDGKEIVEIVFPPMPISGNAWASAQCRRMSAWKRRCDSCERIGVIRVSFTFNGAFQSIADFLRDPRDESRRV